MTVSLPNFNPDSYEAEPVCIFKNPTGPTKQRMPCSFSSSTNTFTLKSLTTDSDLTNGTTYELSLAMTNYNISVNDNFDAYGIQYPSTAGYKDISITIDYNGDGTIDT